MELLAGPIYGTGIAIIAFVVLGNPSAGGAFPRPVPDAHEPVAQATGS